MAIGAMIAVVPTVGWAWPALVPLATAVGAAMGYKKLTQGGENAWLSGKLTKKMNKIRRETILMDEVLAEVIAAEVGPEERISFQRDDFLLVFRRDGRGKFLVEVSGPSTQTALNLKIRGEEFARELVKKFAYHKMVEQLQKRGATIVEEEVLDKGEIKMKARQWS